MSGEFPQFNPEVGQPWQENPIETTEGKQLGDAVPEHPLCEQGEQAENKEQIIARTKEQLPPLKEGYVRGVHFTSPKAAESILQSGLNYEKQGMLSSTARYWQDEDLVEYSTPDRRFAGCVAVIFDAPIKGLRNHENIEKTPGVLPSNYIVGIIQQTK